MAKPLLIRGAKQIVTLHGSGSARRGADLDNIGILSDGAILIADGIIREVGPARRIENLAAARAASEIDASGRVVLPGFVDSHTHLFGSLANVPAEFTDNDPLKLDWPPSANASALAPLSPKGIVNSCLQTLRECIRQGTTTLESKAGQGVDRRGELNVLRAQHSFRALPITIVSSFLATFVPERFEDAPEAYLDWILQEILPVVSKRKLARFIDVQCDEYAFTPGVSRKFLQSARRFGMQLKLQTGQRAGGNGVALVNEFRLASVDDLSHISGDDVQHLARTGIVATLLPGPALYCGFKRFAPARLLLDSGAAVALATDYNLETSPWPSMQTMIALACQRMGMTIAEAIVAATINGAHALDLGDRVGSIEFGKDADLVILGVSDLREIPYHLGVNLVEATIKRGKVAYLAPGIKCSSAA